MVAGSQSGEHFLLDKDAENRLGRGTECSIMLTDPLCSRVHATLAFRDGKWHIADAQSRNGTYVNGQKIDEAALDVGHTIRIGSTEFVFEHSDTPRTQTINENLKIRQTVVGDIRVSDHELRLLSEPRPTSLTDTGDLVMLHQLSVKLLACRDPDEVMRNVLQSLMKHLRGSIVGYLLIDEEGMLKPATVVPELVKQPIVLNEQLTQMVCEKERAIWISNTPLENDRDGKLDAYADAMCIPLVNEGKLLGALHIYLASGRFTQEQFHFAVALVNLAAVALGRALRERLIATDFERLKATSPGYDNLVGASPPMLELRAKITRMARTGSSVLVRGESGTGKELIARAIHLASSRASRPLLAVNCAAIPAELMESQLFGHKAGAFTGADHNHVGYFQQADNSTLFLDEIGELPLAGQSKLLRILEGHPFLPVGSTKEVQVDVRVVAATNRDLLQYVREKRFREDLYYRLAVFELIAPPLRERGDDIGLLVDYFLGHYAKLHNRPGIKLSADARRLLLGYAWPGNVRQLRNVVDSAVVLAVGEVIEPRDLGLREAASSEELTSLRLDEWERKLIIEALKRTGDHIPEAAKLLGIGRATLYRKIEEYGLKNLK